MVDILNDGIPLPSLEQIEQMERQQLQAVEALEYVDVVFESKDGSQQQQRQAVKCQRCHTAVPIAMVGAGAGVFNASIANEIKSKQIQLQRVEKFPHGNNTSTVTRCSDHLIQYS